MAEPQTLWTDLHCHILPGIDDGAKNTETTRQLLAMQQKQGVRQIAFTPHFNADKQSVEEFCKQRAVAARQIVYIAQELKFKFRAKLGAEIYYSPQLADLPLEHLCLQGTRYLLIELPLLYQPQWLEDVLFGVQVKGYIPLIAHIERYPYLLEDPTRIYEMVEAGAVVQVNATSLLRDIKLTKQVCNFIKWGLVHVVASDAHSVKRRPPRIDEAVAVLQHRMGAQTADALLKNAAAVFAGEILMLPEPHQPRRTLTGNYV